MSIIGTLAVNVVARSNELASGLNKAAGAFGGLQGKLSGMIPSLDTVNGLLGGIALGGMAAGFVSVADGLESVLQTSQRLGIASEQFIALRRGAADANIEAETFDKAMTKLYKTLGDAERGSAGAAKGFQNLGINTAVFTKLDAATQLSIIAERLQQMPTAAEKTSAAMVLFGKAGADMQNMLSGGAQGIRDVMAAADEMGVSTFTEERLAKVVAFNDAMDRLRNMIGVAAQNLVIDIAPAASSAVETLATVLNLSLKKSAPAVSWGGAAVATALGDNEAQQQSPLFHKWTNFFAPADGSNPSVFQGMMMAIATPDMGATRNSQGEIINIQRAQLEMQTRMVDETRRNNADSFSVGGTW